MDSEKSLENTKIKRPRKKHTSFSVAAAPAGGPSAFTVHGKQFASNSKKRSRSRSKSQPSSLSADDAGQLAEPLEGRAVPETLSGHGPTLSSSGQDAAAQTFHDLPAVDGVTDHEAALFPEQEPWADYADDFGDVEDADFDNGNPSGATTNQQTRSQDHSSKIKLYCTLLQQQGSLVALYQNDDAVFCFTVLDCTTEVGFLLKV